LELRQTLQEHSNPAVGAATAAETIRKQKFEEKKMASLLTLGSNLK
jgi:hypothetical protein